MANEPLPDGIEEGEIAYAVVSNYVFGVGGYPTAHRVRVTRITATLIKATGPGESWTFRRRDLTMPGSGRGRGGADNRLTTGADPAVRKAQQIASARAALDASAITDLARKADRAIRPTALANDMPTNVEDALRALNTIIEVATDARAKLSRLLAELNA
jgi:predicted ATPase